MENSLYHYGILGMKWGRRRTPAELARARRSKPKSETPDRNSVKTMSDDELRRRVNRLQMEQQYTKLTGGEVSRGKQYVDKIIKTGTTVATVTTTALTIYNNAGKIRAILEKAGK